MGLRASQGLFDRSWNGTQIHFSRVRLRPWSLIEQERKTHEWMLHIYKTIRD